jgi:hypothetical protein
MGSSDLFVICSLSFLAVFIVLTILALIMHLITNFFPYRDASDTALFAAISASMAKFYPGRKIAKIEEIK